jgi:hypothetical protein
MLYIGLLILLCVGSISAEECDKKCDENCLELCDKDFDQALKDHPKMLVDFYNPK